MEGVLHGGEADEEGEEEGDCGCAGADEVLRWCVCVGIGVGVGLFVEGVVVGLDFPACGCVDGAVLGIERVVAFSVVEVW